MKQIKVDEVLNERGSRYGNFDTFASISQNLKDIIYLNLSLEPNTDDELNAVIVEGIDMICHKLARIANGDPYYEDNFIDIAGYATLVANELTKANNETSKS